jgi:hypothetical protein
MAGFESHKLILIKLPMLQAPTAHTYLNSCFGPTMMTKTIICSVTSCAANSSTLYKGILNQEQKEIFGLRESLGAACMYLPLLL